MEDKGKRRGSNYQKGNTREGKKVKLLSTCSASVHSEGLLCEMINYAGIR